MTSFEKSAEQEAQIVATQHQVLPVSTLAELVLEALSNPKYEWRTVEGIAREKSLPPGDVIYALEVDLDDTVIRASFPDDRGRRLYMKRSRYTQRRSLLNRVLSVLSDEVR